MLIRKYTPRAEQCAFRVELTFARNQFCIVCIFTLYIQYCKMNSRWQFKSVFLFILWEFHARMQYILIVSVALTPPRSQHYVFLLNLMFPFGFFFFPLSPVGAAHMCMSRLGITSTLLVSNVSCHLAPLSVIEPL